MQKLYKDVIVRYYTFMKISSMFIGRFIYNPRLENSRRKPRYHKFVTVVGRVFSSQIIFVSLAGILQGVCGILEKYRGYLSHLPLRGLFMYLKGEAICKFKSVQLLKYRIRCEVTICEINSFRIMCKKEIKNRRFCRFNVRNKNKIENLINYGCKSFIIYFKNFF